MTRNYDRARRLGWVSLAGGVAQVLYGLLALFFPYGPDIYYGWDEALWIAAGVGMAGAIGGLLLLDVGAPHPLAWGGGLLALLGVLIRIVASILIISKSSWDPITLILLSILLLLGGMVALGVAILRGGKITGWRAWTPLLVALFGFIVTAIFSVSLFVHFILLGLWGLTWMLVGYVVIDYVARQEAHDHADYDHAVHSTSS